MIKKIIFLFSFCGISHADSFDSCMSIRVSTVAVANTAATLIISSDAARSGTFIVNEDTSSIRIGPIGVSSSVGFLLQGNATLNPDVPLFFRSYLYGYSLNSSSSSKVSILQCFRSP